MESASSPPGVRVGRRLSALEETPADTIQIVVTPHEYYNLFLSENVSRGRARELTRNVVLLCTEQPETVWFHSNLPWVAHARGLIQFNQYHKYTVDEHSLLCVANAERLLYDGDKVKVSVERGKDRSHVVPAKVGHQALQCLVVMIVEDRADAGIAVQVPDEMLAPAPAAFVDQR